MVLSNKKLKQKLRAAKAELITASVAQNDFTDKVSEKSRETSNSLKILLNPEDQRPKISKREKRRQKTGQEDSDIIKHVEIGGDVETKKEDELRSPDVNVKKKKRKRNETEASDSVKEKKPEQLKKKNKKKKKYKKKPKTKTENVQVKEEGAEQNGSGAIIIDQPVAMAYETIDSRKDVEQSPKVYAGGIPYYSTEDDIRSYFEGCGTITAVDCMTFPDTGKFRGIAIITFKTEAAAKRAIALDGSDMGGLFLKIEPFKSAKAHKTSNFAPAVLEGYNRIYIGNLSWDLTEDDLRKLFSDCNITSIRFGQDKETGEFKGYAHVEFADNLSLNVALKLDQSIVCGRPVKISRAVPKMGAAGAVTQLKPMPKPDQVDHGEIHAVAAVSEDQVINNSEVDAVSSKIKRRTCYECGEKGHRSSACPNIQAAELAKPAEVKSMPKYDQVYRAETPAVTPISEDQFYSSEVNLNAVSSKIKRRTCYECGEKGHLSSACPNIQTPESANTSGVQSVPKFDQVYRAEIPAVAPVSEDQYNSNGVNSKAVGSKIKRRTCYECGEKGHLSSACPKNQAADVAKPAEVNSLPKYDQVYRAEIPAVTAVSEDRVISSGINGSATSSKIRRRTCYECGEKGHLSSDCTKKQIADLANPAAV